MRSGRAIARPFGISSATIICTTVTSPNATAIDTPRTAPLAHERLEHRLEQMADRRFGEEADDQRRHRDAELGPASWNDESTQERADQLGSAAAGLGIVVDTTAIDRDQAELRRDEHTVGDDQQAYGEKAERCVDRGLRGWGTSAGVRTAGSVSPPLCSVR